MRYTPDTPYPALGEPFFDAVEPAAFPKTILRYRNDRWAARVGLADLSEQAWIAHFARFDPLPDNLSGPLAMRYHGHQFRVYNPDLGDGRGFLFAQLRDDEGRLLDLGTKGSGQTPWSRMGDGRLTLKGGVREVLATEMLEALGVYTSKSFSLIETGEALRRGDEPSPTRSSVLVRLSHSHIRFGTFQRLAYNSDDAAMERLADYCIAQFYPELSTHSGAERVAALFDAVVRRSARLAASWMAAGFVHGVLNTDNMNVTGESFDYGPYRFAPWADPAFTAAYFDHQGLYAYGRQAEQVAWSLSQFGGCLARISGEDALNAALERYVDAYRAAMVELFHQRLGVAPLGDGSDLEFVSDLMQWMGASQAPFEQAFFDWFCGAASRERAQASPIAEAYSGAWDGLETRLLQRAPVRPERLEAAYFARTHPATLLIDEIEALWARIAEDDDWAAFEEKRAQIAEARAAYGFAPSATG